ncbi:MAG: MFS transporter, partial [Acidimicrobiales bacterium]
SKLGADYYKLLTASVISNLGDGVSIIAYPWLASALTRNPLLIALVGVAQFLPWLIFSLPAGVITDRHDRRSIMVSMNVLRTGLTLVVAFAVLGTQSRLPGVDEITDGIVHNSPLLYAMILLSSLLLGMAQVLYDNTAQTIIPSIVDTQNLEKANGRLWGFEQTANQFVGPVIGSLMLAVAFSLPFFFDAATFAVSAALIVMIPRRITTTEVGAKARAPWKDELKEGVRWLWGHELLRPLAIILGLLNGIFQLAFATLVLFAQDILGTSPQQFALLGTSAATAAIIGAMVSHRINKRIGPGATLRLTLLASGVFTGLVGFASDWRLVWVLFFIMTFFGVGWNVLTVSLRQEIIPDHLLGRVNSVYRFLGWGMIPVGALLGGILVAVLDQTISHEWALRAPWLVAGACNLLLLVYAAPKLTTAKIRGAQAEAVKAEPSTVGA